MDDMMEALRRIESYTGGFKAETLSDPRTLDAVVRNLEVLGEAAKNLPDEVRGRFPGVEWRKMAGFRDVLIHQCFGVDTSIVADVVSNKLPDIKKALGRAFPD
jgi:uncharacterized protein with HEPN domain